MGNQWFQPQSSIVQERNKAAISYISTQLHKWVATRACITGKPTEEYRCKPSVTSQMINPWVCLIFSSSRLTTIIRRCMCLNSMHEVCRAAYRWSSRGKNIMRGNVLLGLCALETHHHGHDDTSLVHARSLTTVVDVARESQQTERLFPDRPQIKNITMSML